MIPGTGGIMPTVVIGAPPMIHHPVLPPPVMPMPFVPPNWQQRLLATPATQPLTLYIGKIPSELDNDFLLKLLETCGKVQKWNRPEDLNARTLKPFGFVTYAQGTSALRCKNVLDGLSICGGTLQIKSGTKETAALNSIASSERSPPPQIDPYTRLPIPQQEIDTNALYDAPLRELVHKLIEKRLNKSESDELDSEIAVLEAKTKGFIRTEEHEDESTYDREKQILREIEKFRERQAKRDRELEQKRNDRIIMKLREMEDQQKNQEETTSKSEVKLTPSTLPLSHSVLKDKDRLNEIDDFNQNNSNNNSNNESSNNNSNGNSNSNGNGNKRELETEEEIEAKRRRRQEVFSMVSGDETQLNFESNQTSQNPPEISGNITETTREQTLANLAASISNKAIGGKLTLKNNMKNATKKAAFGNEDDDSEKRGLRQIIPIDYTEEEQRSLHLTSEEHAAQFLLKMERTNSSSSSINSGAAINNNKNHNNNNNSNNNNNNNNNNEKIRGNKNRKNNTKTSSFTSPNNRGDSHNSHERVSPMSNQESNLRHSPPAIHNHNNHHHHSPSNLNSQSTTPRAQILQPPPTGGSLPQTPPASSGVTTYIHSFPQGPYSYSPHSSHVHPPPSPQSLPTSITSNYQQLQSQQPSLQQQQQQHLHHLNHHQQQQHQQSPQQQHQHQHQQQTQQQNLSINNQRSFVSNSQQSIPTYQVTHMSYPQIPYTSGPPVMIMPGVSHQIPQYSVPVSVSIPPPHSQHPVPSHPQFFQISNTTQPLQLPQQQQLPPQQPQHQPSIQLPYGYSPHPPPPPPPPQPALGNYQTAYQVHPHPFYPQFAYTLPAPSNHGHHHPTISLNSHHPHLDSTLIGGHVPVAAALGDVMLSQQSKTTNSG
eukprot:CAMPEP_0174819048 /NCGR_PEP_ID=MMETSP1107-20130205/2052_1 /TAXON_ID=36770 /ORGANISM="Paraphysomonas vestita, Strain GFlagA" /LENGTH=879 /DNA_ID=CAMNT_0016031837 /DNA_START=26 /DNA_END=2665 /DNA_ORIENTATION=+